MADTLRIRGQEVQIRLTKNGAVQRTLTAIKSCTATIKFNRLTESFLGETSPRNDDIFMGAEVQFEFEPESRDEQEFLAFLRDRASRRSFQQQANSRVNLVAKFFYPNGETPKLTFPDLKFGDIPVNIAGRESYVSQTYSAGCDDFVYAAQ